MSADDTGDCRRYRWIEAHLQRTGIVGKYNVRGADDRAVAYRRWRASSAGSMRSHDAVDQAKLHRCGVEERSNHISGISAPAIVRILVGQRQHVDQRIEAQRVAGGFVAA